MEPANLVLPKYPVEYFTANIVLCIVDILSYPKLPKPPVNLAFDIIGVSVSKLTDPPIDVVPYLEEPTPR